MTMFCVFLFSIFITTYFSLRLFSHLDSTISLLLVCIFACGSLHLVPHFSLGQISANKMSLIMPLFLLKHSYCKQNKIQTPLPNPKPLLELGPNAPLLLFCTRTSWQTKLLLFTNPPPCLCMCCPSLPHFYPPSLPPHTQISPGLWSTAQITPPPGRVSFPMGNKLPFLLFMHRY